MGLKGIMSLIPGFCFKQLFIYSNSSSGKLKLPSQRWSYQFRVWCGLKLCSPLLLENMCPRSWKRCELTNLKVPLAVSNPAAWEAEVQGLPLV